MAGGAMNAVAGRRRVWRTDLLDALYIAVESVTWFMLIRVITTLAERAFLTTLADRVNAERLTNDLFDVATVDRALTAIEVARQASHGPAWPLVALTAFGGFYLIRGMTRMGMDGAVGALVLLFVTVLGLNVLAHLAIAGDLRVWDTSSVAGFIVEPETYFSGQLSIQRFITNPDLAGPHGAAIAVTMIGLSIVWFRFVMAGRQMVTVERMTRSYGGGFAFALIAMIGAALGNVPGLAPWVIVQFVGGVLALAVANHVRATAPTEGPMRPGPWFVAVGGTIGMLVAMAAILGLSVLLHVEVLLAEVGGFALRVVEIILIIIITPIYLVMDFLLRLLLPSGAAGMFDNLARIGANFDQLREQQERGNGGFPDWIANGAKFLAALLIAWALYKIARALMTRRSQGEGPILELRGDASSSGGLGSFLRDLLPRGRRRGRDGWERRHPAYMLWRRAEVDGDERGFSRLSGETAMEFADRAEHRMAAPFPAVAAVFDRLRYGRHQPTVQALTDIDASLTAWEVATPATDELRERLAGAIPLPEAKDFALRIESAKRIARGKPAPGEERPDRPPDMPI
jgi:hypothetical protein